jgi:hypothetical protein
MPIVLKRTKFIKDHLDMLYQTWNATGDSAEEWKAPASATLQLIATHQDSDCNAIEVHGGDRRFAVGSVTW